MDARVWKDEAVAKLFINTVRGTIPMAAEQIVVMRHVVGALCPGFISLLDLDAGMESSGMPCWR